MGAGGFDIGEVGDLVAFAHFEFNFWMVNCLTFKWTAMQLANRLGMKIVPILFSVLAAAILNAASDRTSFGLYLRTIQSIGCVSTRMAVPRCRTSRN